MVTDQSLLDTFEKFYDYFNGRDFTEQSWTQIIDPLLDDSVKMKRLDDPGYHEGKDAVKTYFLYGNGKSDLAFCEVRTREPQVVDGIGFVSGAAEFQDMTTTNPPSRPRLIAYSFTFSKASGAWKAIHLWGKYDGTI